MVRTIGSILSAVFSRWTVFIIIVGFTLWNIHNRIDQIGSAHLHSTNISVVTSMAPE